MFVCLFVETNQYFENQQKYIDISLPLSPSTKVNKKNNSLKYHHQLG